MMHKSIPLILCLAMAVPAMAQPVAGKLNGSDDKGRKQGEWARHWESGSLRYTGNFKDDKPVGLFRHFDEAGVLTSEVEHAGDGRISRARHYHPDGALMATGKYNGQEKDSTWNYFDEAGKARKVERYSNGKFHGEQISYYASGAVAERQNFTEGVQHGEYKSWFENGNLKCEMNYLHGATDGEVRFNHPNGRKETEGRAVKGKNEGTWRYYNEDGGLRLQVVFRNGDIEKEKRENGTFTEYWDGEKVKSEVTYAKGVREGGFVEYHNNGTWLLKHKPADPVSGAPADLERVLEGQTKSREGTYKNDLLEGEVKEYDERGKLTRTARYVAGEAVKGK